jgi:hypothetical protein
LVTLTRTTAITLHPIPTPTLVLPLILILILSLSPVKNAMLRSGGIPAKIVPEGDALPTLAAIITTGSSRTLGVIIGATKVSSVSRSVVEKVPAV